MLYAMNVIVEQMVEMLDESSSSKEPLDCLCSCSESGIMNDQSQRPYISYSVFE
jgi:hypothetical protein